MKTEDVVNALLRRYLQDRQEGTVRSLPEYQAQFAGHEELVARELAQLEEPPGGTPADVGSPDQRDAGAPETIGPYRVVRELGRGGQGRVYLARDEHLNRPVAVKTLGSFGGSTTEQVERFFREAEIASQLDHPGICTVYGTGTESGAPYIAFRYVEGRTLAGEIAASAAPAPDGGVSGETTALRADVMRTVRIVEHAARALHAAHEVGIVHRDVKPGNLMVTPGDEPVILDFGLARALAADHATLTRSGDVFGTPAYMSPEQLAGDSRAIDRRTDVFSLGVTLFECLTRRRPFEARSREGLYRAIQGQAPPDPRRFNRAIPGDLEVVLLTALEKDPAHRYATALDLADDLRRVRLYEPIRARPAGALLRLVRWAQRNRALAAAVSALFLSLVGGLLTAVVLLAQKDGALKIAEEQSTLAAERLARVLRLSDAKRHRDLVAELDELWPCHPERIEDMLRWIDRAEDLLDGLPRHRADLADLRGQSVVGGPAGTAPLRASEQQWWRDALEHLVADLESFASADESAATLAAVRARLAFARGIRERSIDEHAEAWAEAVAALADPARSPAYGGLTICEQLGLVPLGPDPDSQLWEFWHVQTGTRPARDEHGRLQLTEESGLVFVLLPGGEFLMGAQQSDRDEPNYDPRALNQELGVHVVDLDPFFLAKHELTQGQWLRFTGVNPSIYGPEFSTPILPPHITLLHPVERVSWLDCADLARRLGLALPTEAQWEYAVRAGTTTAWWSGADRDSLDGAINAADRAAARVQAPWPSIQDWPELDDGYPLHAPVDALRPNPFGLHHMTGNLWEWCGDRYGDYDQPVAPGDGARENAHERMRVLRGGAYDTAAVDGRSSGRSPGDPEISIHNVGVRLARHLDRE